MTRLIDAVRMALAIAILSAVYGCAGLQVHAGPYAAGVSGIADPIGVSVNVTQNGTDLVGVNAGVSLMGALDAIKSYLPSALGKIL